MTTPFWCILFVLLIPFVLALAGDVFRIKEFGTYDNVHPRDQSASLTGMGARAWAAQQNAWEALAMFVPSVLIAHLAGADPSSSATASIVFCFARVLHAVFYLSKLSTLRSLSYFVALGCCLWLFWLSAGA